MFTFIINPVAGNGRAKRVFSKIQASPLYEEINSTYYFTEYPGHAEEIAGQIAKKAEIPSCVIVIGGDGTLHEVVNGLKGKAISVGFIPGGSGNDFARGCKIGGDPLTIFKRIVAGKQKIAYWLGDYQINNLEKQVCVNSMGFGFDAEIADVANRSEYKKFFNRFGLGSISYVIALLQVLVHFKPMTIDIELNGKKRCLKNCWMVTVANHSFYGGGMKIIPNTKIQPSTMSVLLIHSISKWKVLALFFTVFTGKHTHFREVEIVEAKQLKIQSACEISFQVDGQTGTCTSCVVTKRQPPIFVYGSEIGMQKGAMSDIK